jgi:hypothetical protein
LFCEKLRQRSPRLVEIVLHLGLPVGGDRFSRNIVISPHLVKMRIVCDNWATLAANLPELLNPSLRGYFEALTERDRFIAQMDQALESWDVWLTPVAATPAFTHRPAWSAIEIDGRALPIWAGEWSLHHAL